MLMRFLCANLKRLCRIFLATKSPVTRAASIDQIFHSVFITTRRNTYTMVLAFQDPRDDVVMPQTNYFSAQHLDTYE